MPDSPRHDLPLRVLLVDDHSLFLEGLRNLLVSEGIQVVGLAKDGLEALAQARRLRPDVILMDIQMPRCDGVSATRLIKAETAGVSSRHADHVGRRAGSVRGGQERRVGLPAQTSGCGGFLHVSRGTAQAGTRRSHPAWRKRFSRNLDTGQSSLRPKPRSPTQLPPKPIKRERTSRKAAPLSPRQLQILTLVSQGQTYGQVADDHRHRRTDGQVSHG